MGLSEQRSLRRVDTEREREREMERQREREAERKIAQWGKGKEEKERGIL